MAGYYDNVGNTCAKVSHILVTFTFFHLKYVTIYYYEVLQSQSSQSRPTVNFAVVNTCFHPTFESEIVLVQLIKTQPSLEPHLDVAIVPNITHRATLMAK